MMPLGKHELLLSVAPLAAVLLGGCASCKYGASTHLDARSVSVETPSPADVIGDTLRPLGFTSGYNSKLNFYYYEIGVGSPGRNRISVSWYPATGLLGIYDYRNFEPSELDRNVQDSLRLRFEQAYSEKLVFVPSPARGCLFGP